MKVVQSIQHIRTYYIIEDSVDETDIEAIIENYIECGEVAISEDIIAVTNSMSLEDCNNVLDNAVNMNKKQIDRLYKAAVVHCGIHLGEKLNETVNINSLDEEKINAVIEYLENTSG